ncbi:DUF2550 domain-containing protein [Streptomyces avidinii]|uniref:hypothetical protein n=1 Tax=Streptomyces avidinii TaxID=1895 RepID=UPI003864CD52|nr:DUF2550 domain-containing protein [Streptomyces avidinii]
MLIALLAVLGVNLIVIGFLLLGVLARRRWLRRQPSSFKGAIRVVEGEVPGLPAKWRRGYGRWVRDVLVWEKTPFLFRSEFVLADDLADPDRAAGPGEVKRLGKSVTVVSLAVEGGARIETAAPAGDRERAHGPFFPPERVADPS